MQYRREIDGLRAVAVLPVIFYNSGVPGFAGGYVGVDVFFVISGFLITGILLKDLDQGRFSIVDFYERRCRRILPALLFVLACCIPFSLTLMLPAALEGFGINLLAVVTFCSNIVYWRRSNYFGAGAELDPLLHTWSLAVEEQYYLFFPLLLAGIWSLGRRKIVWILAALAVASLGLSEWGANRYPNAAFFLAPSRIWEILIGSLCAFVPAQRKRRWDDVAALAGLLMIAAAMALYDASTPFPGFHAAVPVVGTALVLIFAEGSSVVGRLLSLRPFVAVGLISYSAYLWHQPLFAFARLNSLSTPSLAQMMILSVVALVLAYLSWRFIERPFRSGARVQGSARRLFAAAAISAGVLGCAGIALWTSEGLPQRMPVAIAPLLDMRAANDPACFNSLSADAIRAGKRCLIGDSEARTSVAVIGDSHADSVTEVLSDHLRTAGRRAAMFSWSWCPPLEMLATASIKKGGCMAARDEALRQIASNPTIATVVFYAEWSNYTTGMRPGDENIARYRFDNGSGDNPTEFAKALAFTLDRLQNKSVILVLPTPEYGFNVPDRAARYLLSGKGQLDDLRMPVASYDERNAAARRILIHEIRSRRIASVDPRDLFCDSSRCRITDDRGRPLFVDGVHLSYWGALKLVPDIVAAVQAASRHPPLAAP